MIVVRAGLVVLAAAVVVLAVGQRTRDHRCARLATATFAAGVDGSAAAARTAAGRVQRDCPRPLLLGQAAAVLRASADPQPALRLARASVAAEPQGTTGWIALAVIDQRLGDRAGERAAKARVHALDRFYRFP